MSSNEMGGDSMKLICDCGQEMTFVTTDEHGVENESTPEEGQFASTNSKKFSFNADYEILYITCEDEDCGKCIHILA